MLQYKDTVGSIDYERTNIHISISIDKNGIVNNIDHNV